MLCNTTYRGDAPRLSFCRLPLFAPVLHCLTLLGCRTERHPYDADLKTPAIVTSAFQASGATIVAIQLTIFLCE